MGYTSVFIKQKTKEGLQNFRIPKIFTYYRKNSKFLNILHTQFQNIFNKNKKRIHISLQKLLN